MLLLWTFGDLPTVLLMESRRKERYIPGCSTHSQSAVDVLDIVHPVSEILLNSSNEHSGSYEFPRDQLCYIIRTHVHRIVRKEVANLMDVLETCRLKQ